MAKKPFPRPLAELVESCMAPALAAQGFAAADVVIAWPEIVGPRLASHCEPVKMQWPPRPRAASPDAPREPATLVVQVESAFALELQHMAPVLVERVNAYFGWRCVGRIALRQGPVSAGRQRRAGRREPDPVSLAEARGRVAGVEDDALREALARLGAGILARQREAGR